MSMGEFLSKGSAVDFGLDPKVKERTITITGPFGIDLNGVPCAPSEMNSRGWWGIYEFVLSKDFTVKVEDAPRELPGPGAVIRATVTVNGVCKRNQILANYAAHGRTWQVLGGTLNGQLVGVRQIDSDWVELVARES